MRKVALLLAMLLLFSLIGCSANPPPATKIDYVFVDEEDGVAISYYPGSIKVSPEYISVQLHQQPKSPINGVKYRINTAHLRPEEKAVKLVDTRQFGESGQELYFYPLDNVWRQPTGTVVYAKIFDAVLDYCRTNNIRLPAYPGPEFKYIGAYGDASYFYNPATINITNGIITAQVREELWEIKEGVKYVQYTFQVNLAKKIAHFLALKIYGPYGEELGSLPDEDSGEDFIPGSIPGRLTSAILDYCKKNNIPVSN